MSIDDGQTWARIPGPPLDEYTEPARRADAAGLGFGIGVAGDLIFVFIDGEASDTNVLWIGKFEQ